MERTEIITIAETDNKEFERKMNELLARNSEKCSVYVGAHSCGLMKLDDQSIPYWQAIVEITTEEQ